MPDIPPERTAQAYSEAVTATSKTVLLEVMTALRSYREALVLVGGWVPRIPNISSPK